MASLLLWLSIAVAVVVGTTLGTSLPGVWVPRVVVALVSGAWALVFTGAVLAFLAGRRGVRSSGVPRLWIVAGCALGVARGALAVPAAGSQRLASTPWTEAERHFPTGIRIFEVQGASVPTGRCGLRVAPLHADGAALRLSAPRELCPRGHGDRVAVAVGSISVTSDASLPGRRGPNRAGGDVSLRSDRVWLARRGRGVGAYTGLGVARLREAAWNASRGDDAAAFVVATALGMRHALAPQHVERLRAAGLGHLIAVSGLHVGIAAWLVVHFVLRVCATARVRPAWGLLAAWVTVGAYVALTGAPASAVRAGTMAVLAGVGDALGRPAHGVLLLVATSAMMLLAHPRWSLDAGFQLSVVAMAVLVTAPPNAGVLLTTWRVTWAIVPVALLHFGGVGAYALLSNLIAVPLATLWILPVGLLGALATPWWGAAALVPAAWGARAVLELAATVASWPPVGAERLAGLAGLSLCGSMLLGWQRDRRWVRAAWVVGLRRGLVPPLAAAATVLCVGLGAHRLAAPNPAPASQWVAIGTPRQYTLVVPGDPAGAPACVVGSTLAAARWPDVLRALGIEKIRRVEPGRRGVSMQAPHLQALLSTLDGAGMLTVPTSQTPCVQPMRADVLEDLRRCQRAQARLHSRAVALRDTVGRLHCFTAGRFLPLQ